VPKVEIQNGFFLSAFLQALSKQDLLKGMLPAHPAKKVLIF
jgi:hypothetical protein